MFVTWEVPLLEKERLLRAARNEYELTEQEVSLIDSQYADPPTEQLFDLILSDLYEVPDNDDEIQEIVKLNKSAAQAELHEARDLHRKL